MAGGHPQQLPAAPADYYRRSGTLDHWREARLLRDLIVLPGEREWFAGEEELDDLQRLLQPCYSDSRTIEAQPSSTVVGL
jgi:hypothetical protein